ncbi:hypothetical protein ACFWMS_25770 [Peribacillus butanolivorans]|uniref:hypothetical protein n=1 Tax=Peribacillus butanolivorans TaxID=421767 RepID=UPI003669C3EC
MEQTSNERPGISVELALEKLHKSGIEMKRQGLTRYLRSGEIYGFPPRVEYPKEGWTVDVDSLQEFINLKTMNVNELRLLVKKLCQENKDLKAVLKRVNGKEKAETEVVVEGQLSLEDVESEVETLEIGRGDIQKLGFGTKQKNQLKEILFKDVPKGEKLKVEVPAGTTIEEYVKKII